jgi:hypothetical protein
VARSALGVLWVGPVVFAAATVLTLVAATSVHSRTDDSLTSNWLDRPWLVGLALALPIQFALLRSGAPGSTLDQLGVLLTIAQWFVIGRIFTLEEDRLAAG